MIDDFYIFKKNGLECECCVESHDLDDPLVTSLSCFLMCYFLDMEIHVIIY